MKKPEKMKKGWSQTDIPSQNGRVAVVTGANSGLGFHASAALALRGARVIMACRNLEKGKMAREQIRSMGPGIDPELRQLDLACLESVQDFAEALLQSEEQLDLLINNAGLMATPYQRTKAGFEMQFGVNHLGHFALSARLWPLLGHTTGSRLVQVSSLAHHWGRIRFEDIHWEKHYSRWGAYGMSKLANLLFIQELNRRCKSSGYPLLPVAAHPGYANTDLQAKSARQEGRTLGAGSFQLVNYLVAQSGPKGALPILYAASAQEVEPGGYYGPGGFLRLRGYPVPEKPHSRGLSHETARSLWSLSEQLTGLSFPA